MHYLLPRNTGRVNPHQKWDEVSISLINNAQTLYSFDQLRYYLNIANGENAAGLEIMLSPWHCLCLHRRCRAFNPVVTLRHCNVISSYLEHLEAHRGDPWADALVYRLGKTSVMDSRQTIENVGVPPVVHVMEEIFTGAGFADPRWITMANIERDLDGNFYMGKWLSFIVYQRIVDQDHIMIQELSALIEAILTYPNPLPSWCKYQTLKLFATTMGCTLSGSEITNIRGKQGVRPQTRKRDRAELVTLENIKQEFRDINHYLPNERTISNMMFPCKYSNSQYHTGQIRCHLHLLENKQSESVYIETELSRKYLVTCVTDEQGLSQSTFLHTDDSGHYLLGLEKVFSAKDLEMIGLSDFHEKLISGEMRFNASARE